MGEYMLTSAETRGPRQPAETRRLLPSGYPISLLRCACCTGNVWDCDDIDGDLVCIQCGEIHAQYRTVARRPRVRARMRVQSGEAA